MKFNIKIYKFLKTKFFFKKTNCFFLYNTIIQKNNYIIKDLIKVTTIHYKLFNSITKLMFQKSIYLKYTSLICGLLIIIFPKTYRALPSLNDFFTLLGVKINNKIYSNVQIKNCITFNYQQNILNLIHTFRISLKSFSFFFILDKKFEIM